MDAVAQLVRKGHHVPGLALIVHQDIGVDRRHRGGREGALGLALAQGGIDPALVEELSGDARHVRGERAVSLEHDGLGLRPREDLLRLVRERRVSVPVRELLHAEPARLHGVIAVREARIGLAHARDKRVDHRGLDAVGEMAAIRHVAEPAPAVGDLLVLGQRVGDQREEADVVLEDLGERLCCRVAARLSRIGQQVQRGLEGEGLGLAFDVEAQAAHGLAEEAIESAAPRLALLGEELLELLVELVGLLLAQILEPRLETRELRVGDRIRKRCLVDLVELELDEDEVGRDARQLLRDVAIEFRTRRIALVRRVEQSRIRAELAHQVGKLLVGGDGIGKRRTVRREARELALIAFLDALGFRGRTLEIAGHGRIVGALVEIGKIPLGDRAEVRGLGCRTALTCRPNDARNEGGAQGRRHQWLQ